MAKIICIEGNTSQAGFTLRSCLKWRKSHVCSEGEMSQKWLNTQSGYAQKSEGKKCLNRK